MAIKLDIRLTKQQKQMVVLGVIALGGGGFSYFKYFWMPVSARIADSKSKIEELEGKISKAQSQANRLKRVQEELAKLNEQTADAEKRLPRVKDVPEVLDTMGRLARKHRVLLYGFSPGGASSRQYFTEIPYALTVAGTYHDIGRFFAAIALEERIFNVRNVGFSVGEKSSTGEQTLRVVFTLVSYQYQG